jgi:hypothetical protein
MMVESECFITTPLSSAARPSLRWCLGVMSLTYFHTTIRVLVLYVVATAALVFALGAPQEFARQLYLPESLDRFLVLWLLAVVLLTLKRLWALWK